MTGYWTLRRVAAAIGCKSSDDRAINAISTDTRSITNGDVFLALRGERFDGHQFLRDAVTRGAAALIVDDGTNAAGLGVPVLVVDNTLTAFGALGAHMRTVWSRPVVAIGGSNGKTTTKELVRSALGATLNVHATAANLNNQIGVPQTLLTLSENADVAVIEVGTNQPGEIAILRDIVQANIAVITTVQEEHLEGFGDLAGVMAEEMSLCNDVALAIVPAGEPAVVAEARKRARKMCAAGLKMGEVRAESFGLEQNGTGWMKVGNLTMRVPAPGVHNIRNAILTIAVARACGVSDVDAAKGIASATFPPMRSAVGPLGEAILLNDAYNANPASMLAALTLLESLGAGRRTVAILGTMRELGPKSDVLHDNVARAAIAGPFDVIAGVGDFVGAFQRVAPNDARVIGAEDPESLWAELAPRLDPRSAVLLKGSRGVRMERLVPKLEAWAGVARSGGQ